MLGLVSHINLMDALIHPRRHNNINLLSLNRPNSSFNDSSESDTIIEDTPDSPIENIDYSCQPPDIGRTVVITHEGLEDPPYDTQKLNKRVVCFSYLNSSDSDPDEYPFHAVTYGESDSCWGLPYNDHNYASYEPDPKLGKPTESDDRLSLLAKLALAKDDSADSLDGQITSQHCSNLQSSWVGEENAAVVSSSKSLSLIELNPSFSSTKRSVVCNSEHHSVSANGQSLVTTASQVSMGNRTILFSNSGGNMNSPLQIHRVSSSLTPHVVLRTSLPALQISTTVPRQVSNDTADSVRCICGNTNLDGYLIQCNQCRIWHHSECISSANKGHLSTPYVCEICQSQPKTITIQHPKLAAYGSVGPATNQSIRISRTSLGTSASPGRIYITTPLGSGAPRQVHVCLPASQGLTNINYGDFRMTSNRSAMVSTVNSSTSVRPANYAQCGQSVRSSKRKQDLLTLTSGSSSANAGLEGFSSSPPASDEYDDLSGVRKSYTMDMKSCFRDISSDSVYQTQGNHPISGPDNRVHIRHNSVVHRLISDCSINKLHNTYAEISDNRHTSLCSTPPDSIMSPSSDVYEEASTLHLSNRLCKKLDLMFPLLAGMAADFRDVDGISKEEIPSNFESLFRYQVVTFDFNHRGLIASEDIRPRTPIIEYRGNCLLMSEYNDMYDYRKHYNPFVLFYKSLPKLPLCVDARKYGNEARFIRRSCTPNSEVRHCISFSNDPHNGPVPQLRLVVIASRLIPKSSEITLPFDFDYTACRYPVKCACVLKGCPVTRWFQRMTQLSNSVRSPTRHPLVCTRKSPHSPRPYGINDHLSLSRSPPLDYGEKVPIEERSDSYFKSSMTTSRKNSIVRTSRLPPTYMPNERNRGLSQVSSHLSVRGYMRNSIMSNGIRKPIRRRGRGRGKSKNPCSMGLRSKHEVEQLPSKIVCRSRSDPKKSLTTTRKRRSLHTPLSLHKEQFPTSPERTDTNIDSFNDSSSSSEGECASKVDSLSSIKTSNLPTESSSKGDQPQILHSKEDSKLCHPLIEEDLDADTEPEYETENRIDISENQICTESSSRQEFHSSKTVKEVVPISDDSSKSPNLEHLKEEAHRDSVDMADLIDHKKRRSLVTNSNKQEVLSRKRTKSCEEKEDVKAKEDVWMAEVLRRIERMEKKRLKQRLPSNTLKSNQDPEYSKGHFELPSPDKQYEPASFSNESNNSNSNIGIINETINISSNTNEAECESEINPEITRCSENNGVVTTGECQTECVGRATTTFEKFELPSSKTNPPLTSSVQVNEEHECISPSNACTKTSILKGKDAHFEGKHSTSRTRYRIRHSVNSRRKFSPPRYKRRRSQAAMLSDSLSSTVDQGGTREDRWLKMQLRRIAELEDHHEEISQPTSANLPEASQFSSDNANEDSSNIRASLFEAICVKSELSGNEKICVEHNPNNCRQHLSPNSSKINTASSFDNSSVNGVTECSNQVSNNQHIFDSEADCSLIVYRTQEKDPMAKFSRSRSVDIHSLFTKIHNEIFEKNMVDTKQDSHASVNDISVACSTQPIPHQAPRPTKKRWLSRALMEEDVESSNHQTLSCSQPINNASVTTPVSSMGVQNMCLTPVNPKKRMIYRLSELPDDPPDHCNNENDENPRTENFKSSPELSNKDSDDIPVICNQDCEDVSEVQEDDESPEALSSHSTPLPPKKATVKQQSEELRLQEIRKVRVSLSEYRRRRGLPAFTPAPVRNHKETKELVNQSNSNIDNLEIIIPPVLLSPNRLLVTLPDIHNESKTSLDVKNADTFLKHITH
ncbi:unnamed protein product [Heterobilharzia americana]|nr:unnamed protein product [Heterobilharzia americana]